MKNQTTATKGGLLAGFAVWLAPRLGLTPELSAALVIGAGACVLYLIPDDLEARFSAEVKKMVGFFPVLLALAVLPSCTTASPLTQCYRAAGGYEVAQIVIEGAVTNPTISPESKATLQSIDREAVKAANSCRTAAEDGDENQVAFYTGLLAAASTQALPLLEVTP